MIDNLIRAATCRVSCGDESGTGHLITDCKVLTARHCIIAAIEATSAIELTFPGVDDKITLPALIVAQSEELDACILSVPTSLERPHVPLSGALPREGSDWRSFGYPTGKTTVGHRISGTISHVLDAPKLKIDIDLSVDSNAILHSYSGLSGAAVISENFNIGMIRLKLDGTLGAISAQRLVEFLAQNGIEIPRVTAEEAASGQRGGTLADRSAFQKAFEELIASNPGDYLFLEGAHGIGKTTFCNEFVPKEQALLNLGTYSILQPGRGLGAIYRAQPGILFDWLSTAVSELVTGKPSRKEERSYVTLVSESSALIEAFSQYCASTRRQGVLFIDGLNEAQVADSKVLGKLIGLLPPSLPPGVTIVLTAPNYSSVAVQLAGRVKARNVTSLPPLSDEASSGYCRRELSEKTTSPALVSRICEKAQGHPLYLRYLIEYANSSPESDALDDFPILTGSIEQYYETLWPRLLQDADAIQLLAIMARLRWGIRTSDLPKVLTPAEQAVFIPTVSRIRHLLLRPDSTTIYHPSFAAFLVSKTVDLDAVVHERLADFCLKHPPLDYCVLNVVFHLLHSGDSGRSLAVDTCSQNWVDACVTLGVEPDVLLSDIEATLATAVMFGLPVKAVRLLLLSQRVSFRYNILFAQSARLMAEALIALKRPREALKHAIRFNTLIVDPEEALQIAFRLIQNECPEEALELLGLLYQRIVEAYALDNIELEGFISICSLHLQTLLFMRLADGRGRMRQIMSVVDNAARVLRTVLAEKPPELLGECLVRVVCLPTSYFLCFRDTYADLAELKEMAEQPPNSGYLLHLFGALLECEQSLETYNLPKELASLPQMFSDIGEIVTGGADLDKQLVTPVVNTLIQLGAPASVVQLVAQKGEERSTRSLKIKSDNGVDVDFRSVHREAIRWRTTAFLDSDLNCPLVGALNEAGWLSSLGQLICALFWCEGKARRAKVDGNQSLRRQCGELLNKAVLHPLGFSLAQRVEWPDSYAIPENLMPFIYERVTAVLMDCFPEELPAFLQSVAESAADQCGLYSEGFREVMHAVLRELMNRKVGPSILPQVVTLLQRWKEHVVCGVENRHELVPEILRLIPLFVMVGASEEGERLYGHVLSVSMGPSWYKEDQLGLMTSVLGKMPASDNVAAMLPLIAGYLERASGEMTFQRFVRHEKSVLIGELFRRGRCTTGCRYFKRQVCGTTAELLSEAAHGCIDKPLPMVGMRYPGGAIDEQHAVLQIVRNTDGVDWRLRWVLLEIYQCGDERHLDDYASEYAKLINQAGNDAATISEMVSRVEFVVGAEVAPDQRGRFVRSFREKLEPAHHCAFLNVLAHATLLDPSNDANAPVASAKGDTSGSQKVQSEDEDDGFYFPGVFGRRSPMREADDALATSEAQFRLGNMDAAKRQAVRVLQILQEGGWSIWGNLSANSTRAEALLREGSQNAADVIRAYAPLLEAERNVPRWSLAEHLIGKVADLVRQDERSLLLQYMIEHVRLMVGDATNEIAMFDFLVAEPTCDASVELFTFVLWLLDHPQWLRRDKAAGMAAWLIESEPAYLEHAAKKKSFR